MDITPFRVITLQRRLPEKAKVFDQKNQWMVDRRRFFDAVDGKTDVLPDSKLNTKGRRGVFLSHMLIYREIMSSMHEYCFIMEDDAVISERFGALLPTILKKMKNEGVEILLIRWDSLDWYLPEVPELKMSENPGGRWSFTQIQKFGGLDAYIVSKKGATMLFNNLNYQGNHPIDIQMGDLSRNNQVPVFALTGLILAENEKVGISQTAEKQEGKTDTKNMSPWVYVFLAFLALFAIFLVLRIVSWIKQKKAEGQTWKIKQLEKTMRDAGRDPSAFNLRTKLQLIRFQEILERDGNILLNPNLKVAEFFQNYGIDPTMSQDRRRLVFNKSPSPYEINEALTWKSLRERAFRRAGEKKARRREK
jgi:GR25 family glycosyltransferase involved in LPS biosynthesis